MGGEFRTRPVNTRNEAVADANARAVALNKNWNYIWFPNGGGMDPACSSDPSGRDPQDVSDLWRRGGDDGGAEANATASGKAVICNKNINIVIY